MREGAPRSGGGTQSLSAGREPSRASLGESERGPAQQGEAPRAKLAEGDAVPFLRTAVPFYGGAMNSAPTGSATCSSTIASIRESCSGVSRQNPRIFGIAAS